MMKFVVYSFFAMFILTTSLFGQHVECISGDTIDPKPGSLQFVYNDSTFLYTLRYNENNFQKYYLEKYDLNNLKLLLKIPVPFSRIDSVKFNYESIVITEDSFRILYSYFDRKSKCGKLEAVSFNEKGERGSAARLLQVSEGNNKRKAGKFGIYGMGRKKEFIVYSAKERNDTNLINLSHYDYQYNKLREDNFKLEEGFGKIVFSHLDNDGNLFYISSSDPEGIRPKLKLRTYSIESDSATDYSLVRPSKYDIYISPRVSSFFSENGTLNIISTYASSNLAKYPFGFYWAQVDIVNHKLIKEAFVKFDRARMKNISKDDFKATSCIITECDEIPNGRFNINFESRRLTSTSVYFIPVENDYEFGDVVSMTVDSSLDPGALFVIPKNQYLRGVGGNYCGFLKLKKNNISYYLFNDLPVNLNVLSGDPKKLRPALIDEAEIMVTLTNDTSIISKSVITHSSGKPIEGLLQPLNKYMLTLSDCISIIEDEKTKTRRIARLRIVEN